MLVSNYQPEKFPLKLILLSGLLVGTLDISSAFIDVYVSSGKNPLLVLPFIASGLLGKSVLDGGAGIMLLGLVLHYIIAFTFTFFFFRIYPRLKLYSINWILTGIGYGIFTWLIMNLIVVQLSAAPHAAISAMKGIKILKSSLILVCMIGLPLSYIAHKFSGAATIDKAAALP